MNHTTLLLGTAIIFLAVGLGYATIPDYIERATNQSGALSEETVSRSTTTSPTTADGSPEAAKLADDDDDWDDDSDEKYEDESEDDDDSQATVASQPTSPAPAPVATPPAPAATSYTLAQVAGHTDSVSCWSAINGNVYDLTPFIKKHPGGSQNILKICGKDGTAAFSGQHGGDTKPENTLAGYFIGSLK